MTTVSSVSTGSAQDVSSVGTANSATGSTTLSLSEIVSAKIKPYLNQADTIATEISGNTTKIASYQQMQTLLTSLRSASSNLTSEALEGSNVFNKRSASLTSTAVVSGNTPSDASTLLSASVSDSTKLGTHTIVVTQIAQSEVDISNTLAVSTTDSLSSVLGSGFSGTFQIGEDGKTAATINITGSESLNDLANAINSTTTTSGVSASVVSVDSTHSVLVLSGSDTSKSLSFTDTSGALATLGVTSSSNQVQKAQSAIVAIDGVSVTRSTNTFSDALSGITLNLKGADANTKVTLTVGTDTGSVATAIQSFVTAYNNWQTFVTANDATNSDGTAASTAVLFGDAALRSSNTELSSEIASMALGITTADQTAVNLAAIGISLNSSNQLEIDTTTLNTALTSNFSGVRSLFTNTVTTTNSGSNTLTAAGTNYSSFSGSISFSYSSGTLTAMNGTTDVSSSFTLTDVTQSDGTVVHQIVGNSSTVYSGLVFNATGTETLGTAVMTMGMANQIYASSKNFGDTNIGSVQTIITNLKSENITLNSQYSTLMTEAQNYTDFLTQQYATLSAKIAASNQTLVTLKALIDAGKSSN